MAHAKLLWWEEAQISVEIEKAGWSRTRKRKRVGVGGGAGTRLCWAPPEPKVWKNWFCECLPEVRVPSSTHGTDTLSWYPQGFGFLQIGTHWNQILRDTRKVHVMSWGSVLPDVWIPEREERRLPKQCNSQKKGSLLLTRIRAPAARPTQW